MEKIKKKVLILGSSGMMGHVLLDYFEKISSLEVYNLSRKSKINSKTIIADIQETEKVKDIIYNISPDYIVNAIGVLVKESESNIHRAIQINSLFPHYLKDIANKVNSKVIHLSTDCVFDGKKGNYDEQSKKTPTDIYGKTKDLGEINSNPHLTIRTSIIGPEIKKNGSGLLMWLFKNKNKRVDGYNKSIWSGLTTLELSKVILNLIDNDIMGLIHISNPPISKYDLISLINDEFDLGITINKVDGIESDKSLISSRNDFKFNIKSYPEMIKELKSYYISNSYKN